MRSRIRRHVDSLLGTTSLSDVAAKLFISQMGQQAAPVEIPDELSRRQYAILLLHIAAAVEHALMVEYLYAGFSLCGPQVPAAHTAEVTQWQETILGIAKEEMGHLMTVQNLLRCIGGPLNLDREDYPWDSELYPFPFRLEPLTLQSLAKFVYVESPGPNEFTGPEADEVRSLAEQDTGGRPVHRVGVLYALLETIFKGRTLLRDADFRQDTFPLQANWDEWGRGYQAGSRGSAMGGAIDRTPDLLLRPVTARTDALDALDAVAKQGEATPTADDQAPSHFARFLRIFRAFPKDGSWSPARNVAVNPVVSNVVGTTKTAPSSSGVTYITHPDTKLWAHLFNVRYRSLLVTLLRTFEYPSNLSETIQLTPRGLLIHATFGEMYNLRSIAQILVQMPLSQHRADSMAGPPFQMPYTLHLPVDPVDRWHLHLDLLEASKALVDRLSDHASGGQRKYLQVLEQADCRMETMIKIILKK